MSLSWALAFFIVAVISAVFGFTGIAAGADEIAKILFVVFVILFLVYLIAGFLSLVYPRRRNLSCGNAHMKIQYLERGDGHTQCSAIHLCGFATPYRGPAIREKLRNLLYNNMKGYRTAILTVGFEGNQRPMRQVLRSLRWWKVWNKYKAFRVCLTGSASGGSLWVVKKRIWRWK